MDYVVAKNSRPHSKRNYTDSGSLQILCPIRTFESSVEATLPGHGRSPETGTLG